jgi:hypothetical protein
MCFGSSTPPPTPAPAAAPPAPAIPATQSATAAEPSQQIGFARKRENKRRFGKTSGPSSRREDAVSTDTGAGIRM